MVVLAEGLQVREIMVGPPMDVVYLVGERSALGPCVGPDSAAPVTVPFERNAPTGGPITGQFGLAIRRVPL